LDSEAFAKEVELAQASEKFGRWPEAIEKYRRALALYAGDFLSEDLYEDWTQAPRIHSVRELRWTKARS